MQGAWIEIVLVPHKGGTRASLPVQGAWIEINMRQIEAEFDTVAPRAGSVD